MTLTTYHPNTQAQSSSQPIQFADWETILSPVSKHTFVSKHLEQSPFLIKRQHPDFYQSLLSLETLFDIFDRNRFEKQDIRIYKDQNQIPFTAYANNSEDFKTQANHDSVIQAFNSGATIIFEKLESKHQALNKLLIKIKNQFHFKVGANIYLTPANCKGFPHHFDTHDVLVLQISGNKNWRISNNPIELPTDDFQPTDFNSLEQQARPLQNCQLEPGDLLYLPRGYMHSATASDSSSLHITISLKGNTGIELAKHSLGSALQRNINLRKYLQFKQPFCQAQFKAELIKEIEATDFNFHFSQLHQDYLGKIRTAALGKFKTVVTQPPLTDSTQCQLNPHMVWHNFEQQDCLLLIFDGKRMEMPKAFSQTIAFIAQHQRFTPAQLPDFTNDMKLKLCERLLNEGFILLD